MSTPLALGNLLAAALVFGPLVATVVLEGRRFRGDSRRRYRDRTYWHLQAWQLGGLLLGVLSAKLLPAMALPAPDWLWPVLGCMVGLSGAALRWWAVRTLGVHFARELQVADDHELIVTARIDISVIRRTRGRSSSS
jgi:protein-S-isoprenylcysteine O-methyltransferase Ste14